MLQSSLFGNNQKITQSVRERNESLRNKAQGASAKQGNITVRSGNALSQKIQLIRQLAETKLQHEVGKYDLITAEAEFSEYIDKCIENGIVSLDTETTGLDPITNHMVGSCLYTPGKKGCYIPNKHTDMTGNVLEGQLTYEQVKPHYQRLVDAGVKFILHNAKFDLRVFTNSIGVKFDPYWCTHIASNLLNENEPHGLKVLYGKYVEKGKAVANNEVNTFSNLFDGVPFNFVPLDVAVLYAGKDPEMTYKLYKFQEQFLDATSDKCYNSNLIEAAHLFRKIEMPLVKYLAEMEDTGLFINTELSDALSVEYHELMRNAAQTAADIISSEFKDLLLALPPAKRNKLGGTIEIGDGKPGITAMISIGSSTQLAILLYDALGLKSPDRGKPRGTGEDILEGLSRANKNAPDAVMNLVKAVLEYRKAGKMLSTYVDKLPRVVKEKTGKLHCNFNQYGAKTGRMSSSDPNLQNIPSHGPGKRVRKMFSAGPGRVLVSSDFSFVKLAEVKLS